MVGLGRREGEEEEEAVGRQEQSGQDWGEGGFGWGSGQDWWWELGGAGCGVGREWEGWGFGRAGEGKVVVGLVGRGGGLTDWRRILPVFW